MCVCRARSSVVVIPGWNQFRELDFQHFSEIDNSHSNSRKNTCIGVLWSRSGIDSGIGTITMMIPVPVPIPAKKWNDNNTSSGYALHRENYAFRDVRMPKKIMTAMKRTNHDGASSVHENFMPRGWFCGDLALAMFFFEDI